MNNDSFMLRYSSKVGTGYGCVRYACVCVTHKHEFDSCHMLANSASLSDSRHGSPHYNSAHSKRSNDNANEWRPCLVEVGKLTGEEHIHSFIVYVCGITSPIRIESIFVNEI